MTSPAKSFIVRVTSRIGATYTADSFETWAEARDYCRHKISYSGDRVKRVEVVDANNGTRVVWDHDWDAQSKHAGLWSE